MLGIRPIISQQAVSVPTIPPKNIQLQIDDDNDTISVESIISDKPPIKDVREFFKDNLDELELMEN